MPTNHGFPMVSKWCRIPSTHGTTAWFERPLPLNRFVRAVDTRTKSSRRSSARLTTKIGTLQTGVVSGWFPSDPKAGTKQHQKPTRKKEEEKSTFVQVFVLFLIIYIHIYIHMVYGVPQNVGVCLGFPSQPAKATPEKNADPIQGSLSQNIVTK